MKPQPMSDPERNGRVSDLYDELAKAGKHGHYESLYRIVRLEVERAIAARDAQWAAMIGEPVAWRHEVKIGVDWYAPWPVQYTKAEAEKDCAMYGKAETLRVSPLYAIKETP